MLRLLGKISAQLFQPESPSKRPYSVLCSPPSPSPSPLTENLFSSHSQVVVPEPAIPADEQCVVLPSPVLGGDPCTLQVTPENSTVHAIIQNLGKWHMGFQMLYGGHPVDSVSADRFLAFSQRCRAAFRCADVPVREEIAKFVRMPSENVSPAKLEKHLLSVLQIIEASTGLASSEKKYFEKNAYIAFVEKINDTVIQCLNVFDTRDFVRDIALQKAKSLQELRQKYITNLPAELRSSLCFGEDKYGDYLNLMTNQESLRAQIFLYHSSKKSFTNGILENQQQQSSIEYQQLVKELQVVQRALKMKFKDFENIIEPLKDDDPIEIAADKKRDEYFAAFMKGVNEGDFTELEKFLCAQPVLQGGIVDFLSKNMKELIQIFCFRSFNEKEDYIPIPPPVLEQEF